MGLPAISSPCLGLCGGCCHFVQFAKLKFQCRHLSLLHFPSIHTYTIKYSWNRGRHECLSYQPRSSCCLFCFLSPHLFHNIPYYSYQNADQKGLVFFFPIGVMYVLAAFAKKNCIPWAFSWLIFIFDSVCNCVCCFCCATALNSVCLTASGCFSFFFLDFWISSHAKVLSFVISLILFDNYFWLVNFSLLSQGLNLIIVTILSLFYILTDPNCNLIFIRNSSSLQITIL